MPIAAGFVVISSIDPIDCRSAGISSVRLAWKTTSRPFWVTIKTILRQHGDVPGQMPLMLRIGGDPRPRSQLQTPSMVETKNHGHQPLPSLHWKDQILSDYRLQTAQPNQRAHHALWYLQSRPLQYLQSKSSLYSRSQVMWGSDAMTSFGWGSPRRTLISIWLSRGAGSVRMLPVRCRWWGRMGAIGLPVRGVIRVCVSSVLLRRWLPSMMPRLAITIWPRSMEATGDCPSTIES